MTNNKVAQRIYYEIIVKSEGRGTIETINAITNILCEEFPEGIEGIAKNQILNIKSTMLKIKNKENLTDDDKNKIIQFYLEISNLIMNDLLK